MKTYYIQNGKAELNITKHAVQRMQERYERTHQVTMSKAEAEERICNLMRIAKREQLNSKELQKRANKKPGTIYFKHGDFRFVVTDRAIVTVEVASKINRQHNHRVGGMTALIKEACWSLNA